MVVHEFFLSNLSISRQFMGHFQWEYQILQCIEILSKRQFNWMMDIAIDIFLEEYIVKKPKEIFKRIGLFENSLNISLTFNVLIV